MRVDVVADSYGTPHLLKNGVIVDRGSGTTNIWAWKYFALKFQNWLLLLLW